MPRAQRPFWKRLLLPAASGETRTRGLRGLRLLIVGLVLLGCLTVLLLVVRGPQGRQRGLGIDRIGDPEASDLGPGTRAYTLYFIDARGRLAPELRAVAAQRSHTEQVEAVVEELLGGSLRGRGRPLPPGTVLRNLFTDEAGTVYIDLSRDAARGQAGSYVSEYACLAALVRTVLVNFPELAAVQLLIDGEPAETLAGHFDIERPLAAADWLHD